LGQGTLAALDHALFDPSELSDERKAELGAAFDKMARGYPELPLTLVFRSAMPNAFALPNGTVVVTDELVELSKNTEEVMAVLAHEIGHVHERHALRMALENSMVALFALAYLGDASQMSVIAGSLPTIYANAHFSRAHETEADTFALEFLTEAQIPRHHFADILRRLHEELGGDTESGALDYFSSHPGLEERVGRFLTASP
jgi:Zn-dependent protease with chaperone function